VRLPLGIALLEDDNYMFRPILAIIRFSSERILVFIRFMQLCNDGEISLSVVLIITTIKRYDWGSGGVFCNVVLVTKYLHLLCIQTDSGTYLASQPMDT